MGDKIKQPRIRIVPAIFAILFIVHIAWAGQFTVRSIVWRMKRYETCNSDLLKWQRQELRYFDAVEKIVRTEPDSAVISVSGDVQLALELAYYTFPRIVKFLPDVSSPTSCISVHVVEKDESR